MAEVMVENKVMVDENAIRCLLQLFQTCEGKDSHYLKEKGHVQIVDVYFVLMNALKSTDHSALPDAVVAVGQLLHNVSWIECLTEEQCAAVILELCSILETTKEKGVCSRALWCFYSQNLSAEMLSKHVKTILLAFSKAVDIERFASSSVEFEATRAMKSLLRTNPQEMLLLGDIWWRDCLVRTVHPAPRVRDMAQSIITEYSHMLSQNDHVMQILPNEVKSTIVPGMLRLFSENSELSALKLWQTIVNLCGKLIHQGSSLINTLLLVVEKAFKYTSDVIRLAAFACWRELISNFAIFPDVIGNVKRLRLIMQPLHGKNAKTEIVLRAKIDTWWHLLSCLGLNQNSFEMVLEPLIRFCFGLADETGPSGLRGLKSRSSSDLSTATSHGASNEVFAANKFLLIEFGIEILGRFFEVFSSSSTVKLPQALTLDPLKNNTLSKQFVLVNHSAMLFHAIEIATCSPLPEKECWTLVSYIWLNVTNHLKSLLDTPENKQNVHDAISNFFQTVAAVVQWDGVDSRTVFAILEHAASLPASVLISSSYNLGQKNMKNGTPGFQLLGLLLSKSVVEKFGYNNKFMALFNRLTTFSSLSSVSVLNSFHLTMQLFSKAVPAIQKDDLICKMWQSVVSRVLEFVEESQEVNQGDSLEHDFSCMYAILVFPFQHFFWKMAVKRGILKKWETLYQVFARCAAVVPGVETNVCCIEFASKLKAVIPESLQIEEIEDMIYVMDILLSSVHWMAVKKSTVNGQENKWLKKKAVQIFELAPVAQLVGCIIASFIKATSNLQPASKPHCVDIASTLLGYFDMFFERLKNDSIVQAISHLSLQFVEIMRLSCNSSSVFADPNVANKVEGVWGKLTKNLPLHYKGAYDSTMLNILSPLLEATFSHKKRSIQMDTRIFWQGTFASSYDQHLIPDSLRKVIEKVKPTIGVDNSSLDDKTVMSSSESKIVTSQSLGIFGSGISSPKVSGSFLNKLNKSPASAKKPISSPALKATPKSKGIEEMNAKDFVVIKSPIKGKGKRRVLTEHQKEVASRRSLIPAMYVDLSQDSCVIPAETQDVEDSQMVVDSDKDSIEEIPIPCSVNLNKENCAVGRQTKSQTSFDMMTETICNDGSLRKTKEDASKNAIMLPIEVSSEISKNNRINTCVAEGSDEANIERLDSHSSVISDKLMLAASTDSTESTNALSVPRSSDSLCDEPGSLTNCGIDEISKDKQADYSQSLNITDTSPTKESKGNTANSSTCTKTRSSLRKYTRKVYTNNRKYKTRSKTSKLEDEFSCDFVAETCEFKEVPLSAESQKALTGSNMRKHTFSDTSSCADDRLQSKETDRENSSVLSDELLQEMGIRSLSSVSVVCEVITAKQISPREVQTVVSSVTTRGDSNTKASQECDDSVIVISSSSSPDIGQSLDTSSAEFGSLRSQSLGKRMSLKACVRGASARSSKDRKSDRLTEEQVLVNIRARKRKFYGSALDSSPPMTRTRKRRKQKYSESAESMDTPSSPEAMICLKSGAQTPLTVENEVATMDSSENSEAPNELQSVTPTAGIDTEHKENISATQKDLSDERAKASANIVLANEIPVESSAETAGDNAEISDMQIDRSSSPLTLPEAMPISVMNNLGDGGAKAAAVSHKNSDITDKLLSGSDFDPEETILKNQDFPVQKDLSDDCTMVSADVLPANETTKGSSKVPEDSLRTSDMPMESCSESSKSAADPLPVAVMRCSPGKNSQAAVLERGFLLSSPDREKNYAMASDPARDSHVPNGNKILRERQEQEDVKNGNDMLQNPPSRKMPRHVSNQSAGAEALCLPAPELTIVSPSVSPSGIMKKAGLNSKTSTPTTPNKRKVSFADPPVQGDSPRTPTSGRRSLARIVNRRLHMTKGHSQDSMDMTQDSYHSPMITELNCTDCLCPELVNSKEPIGILIPHLTSSLHGRGLSKLLSSRNVNTIGDLSAMTEADIHTLPIKAPKLLVVQRALQKVSGKSKTTGNGGASSSTSQNNASAVSVVDDALETTLSTESSPVISIDMTDDGPGRDLNVVLDCSPMKNLEDEMADESLGDISVVDVTPNLDKQLSTSDKCETTGPELVNDNVTATSESVNSNPFQDIYQFLSTRFDQISPARLSQMSGDQIRELIANLGAFSTRVSEAWLDSRCNADPNQKVD